MIYISPDVAHGWLSSPDRKTWDSLPLEAGASEALEVIQQAFPGELVVIRGAERRGCQSAIRDASAAQDAGSYGTER